MQDKIEEIVEDEIKDIVESLGYSLYDVEYLSEQGDNYLRIYIDSEDGIHIEDCEKVSKAIDVKIDKIKQLEEQYFLEVSSPGIEKAIRKDRHLTSSIGKEIVIKLLKPLNDVKTYIGILKDFDNDNINILIENEESISIKRNNIKKMNHIFK